MFNPKEYPKLKRDRWLEEGDRVLSQNELNVLCKEYQHLLGLCDYGIQVIKSKWDESSLVQISIHYYQIKANSERTLLHELLHLLLLKRDWLRGFDSSKKPTALEIELWYRFTERIIFQLTNALLRLEYGDSLLLDG